MGNPDKNRRLCNWFLTGYSLNPVVENVAARVSMGVAAPIVIKSHPRMIRTRQRPGSRTKAERQKSTDTTDDSYSHSSRGFAHWLEVAPPTTSFTEVVEAYHEHDSPREVWGSGQNHRITEYTGGESR